MAAPADRLAANPYDFDAYVELITSLRAEGASEQLKEVRAAFSKHLPLTEGLARRAWCCLPVARLAIVCYVICRLVAGVDQR